MKTAAEIQSFLTADLCKLLAAIPPDTQPGWGTMNVWQMIEHLAWPFKVANGTIVMPQTTPDDKVERVKQIGLLNDRPMQRNFENPLYTEAYKQRRNASIGEALAELDSDIQAFLDHFRGKPDTFKIMHNIFGVLNYEEWLQFHYKHAKHHLEQFGVTIS